MNDQWKMTNDKSLFSISVILPSFNEEKNIRKSVLNIEKYLKSHFKKYEIIVVNDGSTDRTSEIVKDIAKGTEIPLKVIGKKRNEGKGKAVKDGVLVSKCELIMFMDADLAIPIEELDRFIPALEEGNDLAIASRFISKIKILKPVLWYRNIMERVFRVLRMMIINNYDICDTQCGFKLFTRSAALKLFPLLTVNRFSFDSEIIFLAKKMGFKIKELPITLQNPKESHIRIVRDSWNMFWDLIKIRLNDWRGKYEINLMNSFVFTADDFGQSETANKNILKLVKLGKVQRVAVMVDGKFSKGEKALLLESGVKLDVHLEISPITNYGLRITNVFYRSIKFIFLYLTGRIGSKKVEKEWEKQIKKFVKIFGKIPDGLNSHEHVHFFPPYFKVTLKLCKKYDINHIRFPSNRVLSQKNLTGWILKILNYFNKNIFTNYKLHVTRYTNFASLDWFNNFDRFLKNPPSGVTEVVCHPERTMEFEKIRLLK